MPVVKIYQHLPIQNGFEMNFGTKTTYGDFDLIDSYVPISKNIESWNSCPRCHSHPKIWEFDNGRFAGCKCYKMYEGCIRGISVGEYYRQHNTLAGFPDNDLRDNWNERCERLKRFVIMTEIVKS